MYDSHSDFKSTVLLVKEKNEEKKTHSSSEIVDLFLISIVDISREHVWSGRVNPDHPERLKYLRPRCYSSQAEAAF